MANSGRDVYKRQHARHVDPLACGHGLGCQYVMAYPGFGGNLLVHDQVNLVGAERGHQADTVLPFPKRKKTGPIIKASPLDPALNGSLFQPVQDMGRQLDIAVRAIKVEDAVRGGGLGGKLTDRKQDQQNGAQKYAAMFLVRCLHAGDSARKPAARKAANSPPF